MTFQALTTEFVSRALDTKHLGQTQTVLTLTGVTTDSRNVPAGSLFVAIHGDKFDGHDFIQQAVTAGAKAIVVDKDSAALQTMATQGIAVFLVSDTLAAMRALAKAWRQGFKHPVIGIAGSVGKTTTKDLLAALLTRGQDGSVLKTAGSENGFLGIPITLMKLRETFASAVVEIGIDAVGAMTQHLDVVQPDAVIVTAIEEEHLEFLKDLATVAREELFALEFAVKQQKIAAVNIADPMVRARAKEFVGAKSVMFALREDADVSAYDNFLTGHHDGTKLSYSGRVFGQVIAEHSVAMPLPGKHNAANLLGTLALAKALGLSQSDIERGLTTFKASPGRSQINTLGNGQVVVCDYYNASPASTKAGLKLLSDKARGRNGRKIACLGDMLELGTDEERLHRELATTLRDEGIELVLLYGPRMRWLLDEMRGADVHHFASHTELADFLKKSSDKNDTILLKGSRGMKMEEVWNRLQS